MMTVKINCEYGTPRLLCNRFLGVTHSWACQDFDGEWEVPLRRANQEIVP
jgi:hypothetical protein